MSNEQVDLTRMLEQSMHITRPTRIRSNVFKNLDSSVRNPFENAPFKYPSSSPNSLDNTSNGEGNAKTGKPLLYLGRLYTGRHYDGSKIVKRSMRFLPRQQLGINDTRRRGNKRRNLAFICEKTIGNGGCHVSMRQVRLNNFRYMKGDEPIENLVQMRREQQMKEENDLDESSSSDMEQE